MLAADGSPAVREMLVCYSFIYQLPFPIVQGGLHKVIYLLSFLMYGIVYSIARRS